MLFASKMCVSTKNTSFQKKTYFKKHYFYVFSSISSINYDIFFFLTSYMKSFYFNQTFHVSILKSQEHTAILNSTNINNTHSTMGVNVFRLVEFPKYSAGDFWYEITASCESTFRHTVECCPDIVSHFKST